MQIIRVRCPKCQAMPPTGLSEAYNLENLPTGKEDPELQISLFCANETCGNEFTYADARKKDYGAQVIQVEDGFDIYKDGNDLLDSMDKISDISKEKKNKSEKTEEVPETP